MHVDILSFIAFLLILPYHPLWCSNLSLFYNVWLSENITITFLYFLSKVLMKILNKISPQNKYQRISLRNSWFLFSCFFSLAASLFIKLHCKLNEPYQPLHWILDEVGLLYFFCLENHLFYQSNIIAFLLIWRKE